MQKNGETVISDALGEVQFLRAQIVQRSKEILEQASGLYPGEVILITLGEAIKRGQVPPELLINLPLSLAGLVGSRLRHHLLAGLSNDEIKTITRKYRYKDREDLIGFRLIKIFELQLALKCDFGSEWYEGIVAYTLVHYVWKE